METSRLPEPLLSKLKSLSDQQGVTLFMTLLAGFEILLYRYTGQTDISIGSAIANRSRQELEPLIGFFLNTLVLRTQFTEDFSVAELLQRVRDVSLQAYAHQDIPFERLVEALDPARELSRTPFFQVLFALQNAPLPAVTWDGLEATASIVETGTAKFDLTLSAREQDGELELSLEYRTELFNAESMRRLLQHYRTLLEAMAVSVDARIGELEILMVPAALLQLDTMPLTTNGKVDRKALIELESKEAVEEVGSLTFTPTEELIAGVWLSLLGKSEIRRDDNFFALGGHSLISIQMLARVEKVFHREIELRAIFEFPVLKDFSGYVDQLTGPAQAATLQPILPTSRDGNLPLSFAQQRLWFLAQMEGASAAYHIPFGLHLKGDLNRTALRRALDRIVVRHEVLRTTFALRDGEPVQEIDAVEASSFCLIEHDLRGHNDVEAELAALRELEAGASFDLEAGPLIRGRLIRLGENEYVLLVTMHHIVSDGWSMGVLVGELKALYGAFLGEEADPLPELEIQYADYAVWQRQWIEGEILQQQAAYWKTTLAGAPALLELPTDHPRPAQRDFAGGYVELALDEQLTAGLKDLSRRQGTTLYMTLLAGWAILLARLSGQQDVVIGSPMANRGRAEIENLIGFFVNTLALHLDLSGSPRVSELLEQTKAQSLAAQQHQDIPFEQVVELAQPVRSLAHSPLFQVMFSWQNAAEARLELPGLEVQAFEPSPHRVAKFDMTLSLQAAGDTIGGVVEYAGALFEAASVHRYIGYFLALLKAMVADDAQTIDRLPMVSEGERDQVLYGWNETKAEFPSGKCVHELFEEQVARTPQAVAVIYEEERLSYGELNERANRLAHYLRELGVQPDERVAICVERGFEMIVGLLAILKAGGGYVPLDPAYPEERLHYMLEDSAPVVVLTQRHLEDRFSGIGDSVPVLDLNGTAAWQSFSESNPEHTSIGLTPKHLAYVIYTSGSTGQPKGVAIEHRNAVNFVYWAQMSFSGDVLESTLFSTSLNFDLAVYECFVPITVGARVCIVPNALDLARRQVDVTLINTVPSAMKALLEVDGVPKTVRVINLAGEPLKRTLVERIFATTEVSTVCNLYGPSETTTYSTWVPMKRGESLAMHIGRPIANTRVYILDGHREPVPVGVTGELYIGGAGVARGYLNRPELTAERFVADPFVKESEARMYRTGDLGRWLADGTIEFVGRNDFQVKIRGFRIELGEIEARLAEHPAVREAVVLAREDAAGEKRLVAYYTASGIGEAEAASVGAERLRAHLSAVVPDYMVPAAYVCLDRLPLTPNGKLDRKALPAPEQDAYAARGYEAPVGEMETKLAEVWAEVLKLEKVGRHNNFFELGGHSLLATRVISRIREVFHVELPLLSLFQNPTVAGLALKVDGAARTAAPPLRALPREQSPRLSFAQERLWFLSRYEAEASLYNVPVALRLRGPLNREALHASLQEIVARHEVLRTSFPETDGMARQNIASAAGLSMPVVEMVESEMPKFLLQQARLPFDLATGPLIRTCLLQLGSQDQALLVVLHHIVSDGWSLGVMLREFNALYDAFSRGAASPLPPLPIQYADYSEWQREWLQGEVLERQLEYWRKQLAGHETLNLPTDRPYSAKPTLAGAMERSRLPEPLLSKLKLLSDQQGVTLFMTLLAGFEILLYRYTGQTDISVGSAIANRSRQELESLIGFFVNTLVLRTQFTGDSSVAELLQRVRDVSLQAYAHQDIPFERLVEALDPARELSRTPFFQVLFALQNAPLPTVTWQGLEATASIVETGTAKFDLTLSAREEDGELELSLEYRTELFNPERMRRLLQHYRTLLEGIAVSVDARISELEILSEPERQQLLVEWNRAEAPYSTNKCVHRLFEEQAAKTPQAVAVVDEDVQISYEELNRRANRLAHYLTKLGIGPEVRVAVCMERGLEMLAGILGVLKAGGAFVPLDPADPSARRSYMAKDAGAKIVLTKERFTQQMAGCADHVVDLEKAREEIGRQSGDNLNVNPDAENLAWVIYTSSSTGRTKGMAIPHRSAVSMQQQRTLIDAIDQNPSVERLLNLCAPTEDTTSNTQAYILDGHMELVPVGIKGELYLGGAGQARGYMNRPELTAERFVPNPFSKTGGERLYRTGDLVRHQENGNLEFLGRLDSEVKVRGYRIEPGEIEAAVLDYPGVTQAAVIAREDKLGEMRLIGYVAGSERLDVDRLQSHLEQRVPEYMVPAALLQLDTMPLTANGKVDRKALLELESKEAREAGSLALTPTEELIADVWSSLLGKPEIRRDDNFFDLGGHSLTSIQMLARLEQVFHREIELRAIFEFPVLKDFSGYVDRLTGPAPLATLRPIVPTSRDGDLPLSFAQQRLWFLAQMEGASAAYHIPFGLHLKGDLSCTALRRALDRIVVRHEVLRTTFALRDGEPVQEIDAVEASSFCLIEHDLRGHNDVEAELAALRELEAGASFDLAAGPLIRGRLIRLAEDEHVLLVTMHHIVSDGWSMGVLVGELKALYGAFLGGEADPLPELEIQYADYAVWQRQWIEGEILQQQAAYWKTTLSGAPALLELPTDHPRPVRRDFAGGYVELALDEQLTAGLKDLSRRQGTTLYMTLLAGWAILLARLSGQQDVVIGSPVANRGRAEIENLIGFFVNTLALRLDLSGSPRVSELLEQTKAQSLAAQQHQDIPFEQVVELAQPVRSLAHSPLFQVMFSWQNATEARLELPGLEVQPFEPSPHRVAKFDMTLSLQAAGDTIGGVVEYASALFEAASVHRYIGYFLALLKAMVADDAQTIDRLPMVSEGEREQVLYGWNETQAEFPSGKCVHELFEEQVARTPQAVAVIYEEERLNYGELNERANWLAWRLRELGVGPETIVGLMVERSIEMVVALLGVLKAGAAYVPLDPGSTRERLKYMVEDSGARLVLSSVSLSSIISAAKDVEVLSMEAQEWLFYRKEEPRVSVEPSQLAYVIYTSGSTGRPKGVGVEHRQLVNYVQAIGRKLQIEPGVRLGLVSTFAADLGYTMIFPALCHGGCLDVVDADRVLDAGKLEEHFSRHPIDYLKIVPSHMRALLNSNAGSGFLPRRWLILGGEASSWDLIQQVKGRGAGCRVLNHYGPTETTVGVLTCDTTSSNSTQDGGGLQAGGMVPIGRPLSNGKVYVLDSELNPVGVGVSGEIYIAGAGVARGYLKREDLTAEKFLANPYSAEPGGRMYRTGDLGRYLENGNVVFLGRKDHQVKIRGFRVELGEIETTLMEHPKVRESVVLAREDESGEKWLVAYVVPERESEESSNGSGRVGLQMSELREHLLGKLPEYMVPTAYVQLKRIPLTPNGKLDRKSLPEPDKDIREQEYVGPRNATEETLCRLWQEVLRRERVGLHDNFFNIGGHSLLAVQVISRIKQAFTVEMPLSVLFAAPTVARMAEHIAAVNEPDRSQSSPVLVNIQPHGSWPPFFCVHAIGGQVIGYAELSQGLGLEQPFYGLQSPPANYFPESDVSIEQLATLYNQEIRSVQPRGPYLLSGWSMGGLVAWEMAQQLMREGETISLLALIDTAPPPRYREADDRADEISMLALFAMDMSRLVGRDPGPLVKQFLQADEQDQWKTVQETLTRFGVLAPKTAHAEMTALLEIYTRNFRAMNNYSIQTSKQEVIYFRASETPERFSRVWTKWSGGGIQFHSVPGDHFTMLRRPGVRIIAETLQRYLSMNSNNEWRAVSQEMSPREL
jgi:amino acid adenylation domain-containing protein